MPQCWLSSPWQRQFSMYWGLQCMVAAFVSLGTGVFAWSVACCFRLPVVVVHVAVVAMLAVGIVVVAS